GKISAKKTGDKQSAQFRLIALRLVVEILSMPLFMRTSVRRRVGLKLMGAHLHKPSQCSRRNLYQ
ncbi:MAG: hypothetical protein K8S55_10700, partial [Phycisphaerae bacterium]|nr:hypothetical protein [Phycisphaerae bacterium]